MVSWRWFTLGFFSPIIASSFYCSCFFQLTVHLFNHTYTIPPPPFFFSLHYLVAMSATGAKPAFSQLGLCKHRWARGWGQRLQLLACPHLWSNHDFTARVGSALLRDWTLNFQFSTQQSSEMLFQRYGLLLFECGFPGFPRTEQTPVCWVKLC